MLSHKLPKVRTSAYSWMVVQLVECTYYYHVQQPVFKSQFPLQVETFVSSKLVLQGSLYHFYFILSFSARVNTVTWCQHYTTNLSLLIVNFSFRIFQMDRIERNWKQREDKERNCEVSADLFCKWSLLMIMCA